MVAAPAAAAAVVKADGVASCRCGGARGRRRRVDGRIARADGKGCSLTGGGGGAARLGVALSVAQIAARGGRASSACGVMSAR